MAVKSFVLLDSVEHIYQEPCLIGPEDVGGTGRRVSDRLAAVAGGLSEGVDILVVDNGTFSFIVVPTSCGMGLCVLAAMTDARLETADRRPGPSDVRAGRRTERARLARRLRRTAGAADSKAMVLPSLIPRHIACAIPSTGVSRTSRLIASSCPTTASRTDRRDRSGGRIAFSLLELAHDESLSDEARPTRGRRAGRNSEPPVVRGPASFRCSPCQLRVLSLDAGFCRVRRFPPRSSSRAMRNSGEACRPSGTVMPVRKRASKNRCTSRRCTGTLKEGLVLLCNAQATCAPVSCTTPGNSRASRSGRYCAGGRICHRFGTGDELPESTFVRRKARSCGATCTGRHRNAGPDAWNRTSRRAK